MVFPKSHIAEILKREDRDLTRFDLDFDLPDQFLPDFRRRFRAASPSNDSGKPASRPETAPTGILRPSPAFASPPTRPARRGMTALA